jgi:hypothetical protein
MIDIETIVGIPRTGLLNKYRLTTSTLIKIMITAIQIVPMTFRPEMREA